MLPLSIALHSYINTELYGKGHSLGNLLEAPYLSEKHTSTPLNNSCSMPELLGELQFWSYVLLNGFSVNINLFM